MMCRSDEYLDFSCERTSRDDNSEFTKAFPAFRNGPEGLLKELLTVSRRQIVPAGTQIYREGDACSAIAFVLSGEIRVYKIGQTGREITLYEIGPGETCILNASCILSGQSLSRQRSDPVGYRSVPGAVRGVPEAHRGA